MKEGPNEIVIPEKRFLSCGACIYYAISMVKSGNNPIYRENCSHPEVYIPSLQSFHEGNLRRNLSGYTQTPDWCPFLTSNRRKVLTEKNK